LNTTIENWKRLGAEKDQQIKDLSSKLEKIMRNQARMEEQIAQKQRDIALQVEDERAALEARISELELECDSARAAADGMEKAQSRLTRELVKVHEQFSGAAPAVAPSPVTTAEVLVKTGEKLRLAIYKEGNKVEMRATELPDGVEEKVPVDAGLMGELDQADPWTELFARTGVDPGPPRRIVVSTKLGEQEVPVGPRGTSVLLTAYRYSAKRFYMAGMDLLSQKMLNLTITEQNMTPALKAKLSKCSDDRSTFDALAAALTLNASGDALTLA